MKNKQMIDAVKRSIYRHESCMNPHYDINPEIALNSEVSKYHSKFRTSGMHNIRYEVEYISRLDLKWRKWYSKEISIDIDKAIAEYRDIILEEILKGPDS